MNVNRLRTVFGIIVLVSLVSCRGPVFDDGTGAETGSLTVSVTIPNYKAAVNGGSRVLDSKSASVELYLNGALSGEQALTGGIAADGGVQYSLEFDVPVPIRGAYDTVKLVFLDSAGTPLTEGTARNVTVAGEGSTVMLEVGCVPSSFEQAVFSGGQAEFTTALSAGQTTYFGFDAAPHRTYVIEAAGSPGSDPDIFLFASTGRFLGGSAEPGSPFETYSRVAAESGSFFIGVYASAGAAHCLVTVTETNRPPVANAGKDILISEGVAAQFDGSASVDPEGDTVTLSWLIENAAGDTVATLSGATPSHTFTAAGAYTVTLTAADSGDASAEDTLTVYVGETAAPPVADAGPDIGCREGDTIELDGSDSYDPNEADALSFTWVVKDDAGAEAANGTGERYSWTPAASGTYTAELTVSDGSAADTDTAIVTVVKNIAPEAAASASSVKVGLNQTVTFDAAGSSDSDDAAGLTCAWTFGDGNTASGVTAEHAYTVAGTYTVTLTVTDPKGASDTATLQIVAETGFNFSVAFDASITDSVTSVSPVKLALVDTDLNWATVCVRTLSGPGEVRIMTGEILGGYNPGHRYVLFVVHDIDNDLTVQGFGTAGRILDDVSDTIAVYTSAEVTGHVLFDGELVNTNTELLVQPDTPYALTLRKATGTVNLSIK